MSHDSFSISRNVPDIVQRPFQDVEDAINDVDRRLSGLEDGLISDTDIPERRSVTSRSVTTIVDDDGVQNLSDLDDVNVAAPSDGSFIQYDNSSSLWKLSTELTSDGSGNLTVASGTVTLSDDGIFDADEVVSNTGQNDSPRAIWRGKYDSDTSASVTSSAWEWDTYHRMLSSTTESEAQSTLSFVSPQNREMFVLEHSLNNTSSPDSSDHVTMRYGGNARIGVTASDLPWIINQANTDHYGEGIGGYLAYTGPKDTGVMHSIAMGVTHAPNDLGKKEVIFQTEAHDTGQGSESTIPIRFYADDYRLKISGNDDGTGKVTIENDGNETDFEVQDGNSEFFKTAGLPVRVQRKVSGQTGVVSGLAVASKDTDGAGTNGIGTSLSFEATDSAGNQDQAGFLSFEWTDATSTTEDAEFALGGMEGGSNTFWYRATPSSFYPVDDSQESLGNTGNVWDKVWTDQLDSDGSTISVNSNKLTNVTDPTSAQHAATKNYVDNNAGGASQLTDLSDVGTAATTDGHVLAADGTNYDGEAITSVTEAHVNLGDLKDVDTTVSNAQLTNSSVTVAGNAVSLGGSTAINHSDLSSIGASDHHAKYTNTEAVSAVDGSTLDKLTIDGTVNQLRVLGSNSQLDIEDNPGGDGVDINVSANDILRVGQINAGSIDAGYSITSAGQSAIRSVSGQGVELRDGSTLMINAQAQSFTFKDGNNDRAIANGSIGGGSTLELQTTGASSLTTALLIRGGSSTKDLEGYDDTGSQQLHMHMDDGASTTNGDMEIAGGLTENNTFSDPALKENIRDLGYGLDEILSLSSILYDMPLGDIRNRPGFDAEEVKTSMPELVGEKVFLGELGPGQRRSDKGLPQRLTLRNEDLVPVLVQAIQEQQNEIESLRDRLNGLP